MMKYLIVLLDDTSVSFCHYSNDGRTKKLMPLDTLSEVIRFGMKENLYFQFVYPDYCIPEQYEILISSVEHIKLRPLASASEDDICITSMPELAESIPVGRNIVVRASCGELSDNLITLKRVLAANERLNIIVKDDLPIDSQSIDAYSSLLEHLSDMVHAIASNTGRIPQLNLLTDRLSLKTMNNCSAGVEAVTVAPDGNFYICPGFYYEGDINVGSLPTGINIPNARLYSLDYAPICSKCDAFHCRRCVWLNKKHTLEVNTPSRRQCIMAHLERNTSGRLQARLKETGAQLPDVSIPKIDYLDPFEIIER